ncbi:hypothetical protein LPC08_23795 [Roseomonas sp. OT10]|uniref:hypothetical protein n=1 Tax=Roseomonas cutis TaxID=2897332 RepID=UPI001E5DE83C|nr:hypothetical protein [Roseomonas sp. OT10]UFN48983.1 hypothetical protein LPC08_23795 [Roseomonas sp. OT10]
MTRMPRPTLLLLLALAFPAAAEELRPVPEALRGTWFAGACAAPEEMLVLTARSAARLSAEDSRLDRFVATREADGWLIGTSRGAEAPRLMLRARDSMLETGEPEAKLRDDRLPGPTPLRRWQRCATPPLEWMLQHGEGIAVLGALERIEAACGEGATMQGCAEALIAQASVSGDGLLSAAELARLGRGLTWMIAVREGAGTPEIALAVGAGSVAALGAARLAVDSLDYDGDGRLSVRELMQDRSLPGPGGGEAAGRPLRLDGIREAVGFLRGLFEGLFALR